MVIISNVQFVYSNMMTIEQEFCAFEPITMVDANSIASCEFVG